MIGHRIFFDKPWLSLPPLLFSLFRGKREGPKLEETGPADLHFPQESVSLVSQSNPGDESANDSSSSRQVLARSSVGKGLRFSERKEKFITSFACERVCDEVFIVTLWN